MVRERGKQRSLVSPVGVTNRASFTYYISIHLLSLLLLVEKLDSKNFSHNLIQSWLCSQAPLLSEQLSRSVLDIPSRLSSVPVWFFSCF